MPRRGAVTNNIMLSLAMGCGTGWGRSFGRAGGGGSRRRLPQTICVYAHAPDATLVKESNGRAAYFTLSSEGEVMSGGEHLPSLPEHNLGGK
jgi:hypothetical protein